MAAGINTIRKTVRRDVLEFEKFCLLKDVEINLLDDDDAGRGEGSMPNAEVVKVTNQFFPHLTAKEAKCLHPKALELHYFFRRKGNGYVLCELRLEGMGEGRIAFEEAAMKEVLNILPNAYLAIVILHPLPTRTPIVMHCAINEIEKGVVVGKTVKWGPTDVCPDPDEGNNLFASYPFPNMNGKSGLLRLEIWWETVMISIDPNPAGALPKDVVIVGRNNAMVQLHEWVLKARSVYAELKERCKLGSKMIPLPWIDMREVSIEAVEIFVNHLYGHGLRRSALSIPVDDLVQLFILGRKYNLVDLYRPLEAGLKEAWSTDKIRRKFSVEHIISISIALIADNEREGEFSDLGWICYTYIHENESFVMESDILKPQDATAAKFCIRSRLKEYRRVIAHPKLNK